MTTFWFLTAILTVIACAFIAFPLFKKHTFDDNSQRDELNKAFYKERLEELEKETEEGTVDQASDLIVDLKKSLLLDIPQDKAQKRSVALSPIQVFIPSALLLFVISYGFYMAFGASHQVSHWQNVTSEFSDLRKKLMSPETDTLTKKETSDLKLALRTRLHHQPNDTQGWLLLGRVAQSDSDMNTAIAALEKAYKLDSKDPDIRFSYAESLMMLAEEKDQRKARTLLIGLLQDGYADLRVYSLLAFNAYQKGSYEEAIYFWRMMQNQIGADDSRYKMLERSIHSAEQKLGKSVTNVSVSITISISEDVHLPAQGTLIVSAFDVSRSSDINNSSNINNSSVPIAAAGFPIGSFPRTVVLDDNNVMTKGQSLSQLTNLKVRARIDSDGNIATQQGDWYGDSQVVKSGEQVTLVINKQY